jgi:hypothetical protein
MFFSTLDLTKLLFLKSNIKGTITVDFPSLFSHRVGGRGRGGGGRGTHSLNAAKSFLIQDKGRGGDALGEEGEGVGEEGEGVGVVGGG